MSDVRNQQQFWHLTSHKNFKPNPNFVPQNNSTYLSRAMQEKGAPGLYVTHDPEYWMQAHGYERPYVAEVEGTVNDAAGLVREREHFLQGPLRTKRVLTIDEYAREKFHAPGWVEDYHGPPQSWTEPLSEYHARNNARFPADYKARTTAEMTPEELKTYGKQFRAWTKRSG